MTNIFIYLLVLVVGIFHEKMPFLQKFTNKVNFKGVMKAYFGYLKGFLEKGIVGVIIVALATWAALAIIGFLLFLLFSNMGYFIFVLLIMAIIFMTNYADQQENSLVIAHENLFGVLFWFIILGWSGAFLYWFFVALKKESLELNAADQGKIFLVATRLHGILAWIPARLTGLIYGFAGNFYTTYKIWLDSIMNPGMPSSEVLINCGQSALGDNKDKAENLIKRSLIIWCSIGIIFALIFLDY